MTTPQLLATCWTTAGDAFPLPGHDDSPIPLHTRIEQAARAGFTGFGVVHNDLERYLADHDLKTLRQVLQDNGMTAVELEFLTDWWKVGDERAESDRILRLLLDATEVLHPHHVKAGPDIHGGSYDVGHWAEQWHRVSEAFAQAGTVVALEFMPFSNISNLDKAVELVRTAGHPAGGLMVDMWHVMRGDAHQLPQLEELPLELITGVEFDDADADQVGDGYSDTVMRRRLPGQGAWPVHEFIRILREKGWEGPWGVEILSDTYRVRPLEEALPDVHRAAMQQFQLADQAMAR